MFRTITDKILQLVAVVLAKNLLDFSTTGFFAFGMAWIQSRTDTRAYWEFFGRVFSKEVSSDNNNSIYCKVFIFLVVIPISYNNNCKISFSRIWQSKREELWLDGKF